MLHHQVSNVLEPDGTFVKLASIFGRDAINHSGGIEGTDDSTRPLLSLDCPAQKHRDNLVRIDKTAIFRNGADAVGIAVGGKSGMAFLFNNNFLLHRNMRLNGLGIDSRE